jgi:hypothetical protein
MNVSLSLIAAAAFAVSASAQTTQANGTASVTGSAQTTASHSGDATSASAQQVTGVSAELNHKIDSKDAKIGDEVVAKTTSDTRLSDGTRIPKGSRLVGHVTDVQAKSRANEDAHIAFAFDHAITRDGRQIPIHAVMQSVSAPAPVAAASGSDDMMAGAGPAGGSMGGGGAMRAGSGGGGGLLGGTAGSASGALRGTTSAAGGLAGNTTSGVGATASSAAGTTSSLGRGTADLAGNAESSGSFTAPSGLVGNLSGVTFSTVNASGEASRSGVSGSAGSSSATLLSAHGKNVSLDSGSQMTLAIAPQP